MSTNDRAGQKDPAHTTASDAGDRSDTEDEVRRCPGCGAPVESVEKVGEVSFDLEPCGHQIDDRIYDEWVSEGSDDSPFSST